MCANKLNFLVVFVSAPQIVIECIKFYILTQSITAGEKVKIIWVDNVIFTLNDFSGNEAPKSENLPSSKQDRVNIVFNRSAVFNNIECLRK